MSDDPEVIQLAREWLSKAEGDFAAARTLFGLDGAPWIICFHAQQAVEKYLKTLLVVRQTPFGKVHDIDELLRALPEPERPPLDAEAASDLTRHAVASRYPEAAEPSLEEAGRAVGYAAKVRDFVRKALPAACIEP
jgi:HEPN domain-containing protein